MRMRDRFPTRNHVLKVVHEKNTRFTTWGHHARVLRHILEEGAYWNTPIVTG